MTEPPSPPPGGHSLDRTFGTVDAHAPASGPQNHRKRNTLILTGVGVIVVSAVCVGLQLGANLGYDAALDSFEDTTEQAKSSQSQLEDGVATYSTMTDAATTIATADSGTLMDATTQEAFAAALDEAKSAETVASDLADEPLPSADDKPTWAWELLGATASLNEEQSEVASTRVEINAAKSDLADAADAVDEAGTAAVVSAVGATEAFEAAHVSARNPDILSLRDAANELTDTEQLDESVAAAYLDLEAAASAMLISEQAEIAEKQGPLLDARTQAEAFARDLAPGVLLDFDWAPIVNSYGDGDSMGGLATWWYGDPGYATIELSNSVAAYWPSAASQALTAHEVGHAISVRCQGMYDDSNQASIEAWATAWAISMGFTDDANGTSAYGAPPQSLIDAAAACR